MARAISVNELVKHATRTHQSASRLVEPTRFLATFRERRFVRTIDRFVQALRHVPNGEIEHASRDEETRVRSLINGIVQDVEAFLERHRPTTVPQLKRNQRLETRIYGLRQAFEAIARHRTPDPNLVLNPDLEV
jgi:hypothetical protein